MKKVIKSFAAIIAVVLLVTSCKKEATEQVSNNANSNEISQEVLAQIKEKGFGTGSAQKVEGGYLVEGDILLTNEYLSNKSVSQFIRVGDEEQYRTTNTVRALPRTIYVRVSTALPATFFTATDAAIARYNALGLLIKFQRVTAGGNIVINPAPAGAGYLASAGFPSITDQPYNQVLVNYNALANCSPGTKTSVIAHELGHCIGFRHTDYANRSYSCGGAPVNEGAGSVGAIHIPGTPTGPNAGSWMLACIGCGTDRPFTFYDRVALNHMY